MAVRRKQGPQAVGKSPAAQFHRADLVHQNMRNMRIRKHFREGPLRVMKGFLKEQERTVKEQSGTERTRRNPFGIRTPDIAHALRWAHLFRCVRMIRSVRTLHSDRIFHDFRTFRPVRAYRKHAIWTTG